MPPQSSLAAWQKEKCETESRPQNLSTPAQELSSHNEHRPQSNVEATGCGYCSRPTSVANTSRRFRDHDGAIIDDQTINEGNPCSTRLPFDREARPNSVKCYARTTPRPDRGGSVMARRSATQPQGTRFRRAIAHATANWVRLPDRAQSGRLKTPNQGGWHCSLGSPPSRSRFWDPCLCGGGFFMHPLADRRFIFRDSFLNQPAGDTVRFGQ